MATAPRPRVRPGPWKKLAASVGFVRIVRNWREHYLATYGSTRPPRLVYRLRNGLELEGRPRTLDVAVLKDVFLHQVYSPPGFDLADGAVVVDVGAHIGAFAVAAARAARDVRVLAFEPHPANFEILTANLSRNGITNVRPFCSAVAGGGGTRDLNVSANTAGHSLHLAEGSGARLSVPALTLAQILEEHRLERIDLLKMDCEGAEYEILEAAAGAPLSRVRRIAMEAHAIDETRTPERLVALLQREGFRLRTSAKGDATSMIWATRR